VDSWEVARLESGGTLHAVEVVVEARGAGDEEGGRDADEVDVLLQVVFEGGFAEGEGFLELEAILEDGLVASVEAMFGWEISERMMLIEFVDRAERIVPIKLTLGREASEGVVAVERARHGFGKALMCYEAQKVG
jgi:hypothetical protein